MPKLGHIWAKLLARIVEVVVFCLVDGPCEIAPDSDVNRTIRATAHHYRVMLPIASCRLVREKSRATWTVCRSVRSLRINLVLEVPHNCSDDKGLGWLEFLEGGPRDKTTWRILVRARTPKRAISKKYPGTRACTRVPGMQLFLKIRISKDPLEI